jgi:hypothetical protein
MSEYESGGVVWGGVKDYPRKSQASTRKKVKYGFVWFGESRSPVALDLPVRVNLELPQR